ncbi:MAG: hypothetical protein K8M05_19175, partial [Deltaproteobacteria bacterium]|nr:hypothetical protein [Kofleriaceae bacterium]
MGWTPILEGELADTAWTVIRGVARELAAGRAAPRDVGDAVLFWSYLAGALEEDWVIDEQERAYARLLEAMQEGAPSPSLYEGLAGRGWVLAHVAEPEAVDELLQVVDAQIANALDLLQGNYDLIYGLVGVALYYLERGDAPSARRGLARTVERLLALSERVPPGLAWFTPPERVPAVQRATWPDGYFNCGIAHGNPGVLALLARLDDPVARAAAGDLARWLT